MTIRDTIDGSRTRGDALPKAAGDTSVTQATLAAINYPTPSAWRPDLELGDGLAAINEEIGVIEGGTEKVVDHANLDKVYGLWRLSPLLQPLIQALSDNVYGVGFTIVPLLDPEGEAALARVKEILSFEKMDGDFDKDAAVSDEEAEKELARLRVRIRNEKLFLEQFMENAGGTGLDFQRMSVLVGQDMEVADSGYWEVIRDGETRRPKRLDWVPGWTVRAKPLQDNFVLFKAKKRVSPLRCEDQKHIQRFRSFVQIDWNGNLVGRYKQFGDPRCMSRKTGKFYVDLAEMGENPEEWDLHKDTDGKPIEVLALPATEILQFSIPNAGSSTYGSASWVGTYPGVEGVRDLDEENKLVVTDQKIPQMMLFIAGGRGVPAEDIAVFQQKIAERKPGERGLFIFQAVSQQYAGAGAGSDPKFHVERTKSVQHTDALGMSYKADAYAQLRRAYRMPNVSLGDVGDAPKATAQMMIQFTETQVYDPRRDLFVAPLNDQLLPALGIECVKLKPRSRVPRDPEVLANIIKTLVGASVLSPDEGREFAGDIFNKDFRGLADQWSKLPVPLLTAILQTKNQLVAAALLSDKEDLIEQLQGALMGELANPASPGEGDPPQRSSEGDEDDDEESGEPGGPTF